MTWTVHASDNRSFTYHRDDERLDVLINDQAVDQLTASRLLWAPQLLTSPEPPVFGASMVEQRAWAARRGRDIIRQGMADVLAWLAGGVTDAAR